jgi:hypothetical protein
LAKVRADRTVIVIGAFLFIVGLAVAWNSYGFIEVERGWTLVIAGTVAFSTGLLLVALGLVLRELREISSSASKAALLLAKAKNTYPPEISVEPLAAREPAAEPEKAIEPPPEPEWEPKWEPEPEQPAVAETQPSEPEHEPTQALAAALAEPPGEKQDKPLTWMTRSNWTETPKMPHSEKSDDWLFKTIAGPLSVAGASGVAEPHAAEPRAPEHAPEQLVEQQKAADDPFASGELPYDELEEKLAAELARPEPECEPEFLHEAHEAPASHPDLHPEPQNVEPEPHPVEPEQHASEPEPHPVEPEPQAAEPEEDAAKSEIIGHYEAHGAHYTMYADGSIDAETVHGVYRFASMEELKRFIEGQE